MKHLLLLGPVALVLGQKIPEERRKTRVAVLAAGGLATAIGAWRAYASAAK